jgi:hypothetical protein
LYLKVKLKLNKCQKNHFVLKTNIVTFKSFKKFNENELSNGVYIVVMHATRIPPHIGLIIDKHYHSLTIKGRDIDTPIRALVKNIEQRKIPSLFIKIKPHVTFSNAYMREHFILNVKQFSRVDKDVATCLSPIKLFFDEVYDVRMKEINFLFDLLPHLFADDLVEFTSALFVNEAAYQLPVYTQQELDNEIENARKEIRNNTAIFPETAFIQSN